LHGSPRRHRAAIARSLDLIPNLTHSASTPRHDLALRAGRMTQRAAAPPPHLERVMLDETACSDHCLTRVRPVRVIKGSSVRASRTSAPRKEDMRCCPECFPSQDDPVGSLGDFARVRYGRSHREQPPQSAFSTAVLPGLDAPDIPTARTDSPLQFRLLDVERRALLMKSFRPQLPCNFCVE